MQPKAANDNTPQPQPTARPAWFDVRLMQYEPLMRNMAYKYRGWLDADDVYQEAVLTVLRRWASYRGGADSPGFGTWLTYQVREAAQRCRSVDSKERHFDSLDDVDRATASAPSHELSIDAELMLRKCSSAQRDVITMAAAGYDYSEIGSAHDVTKQAVQLRIIAGRNRVRSGLRQANVIAGLVAMQRAANDNEPKKRAA
jgi:RNA polymerase sigma factor (sigma-70 family)